MKVKMVFVNGEPKISIYDLDGVLLELVGRTEYIVSKDVHADTLATWLNFYIKRDGHDWVFGYKSNCQFMNDKAIILDELVEKANKAIRRKQSVDLSHEFDTLEKNVEPYVFAGLFSQMNERYHPVSSYGDINQEIDKMRLFLKDNISPEQLEEDEHIYNFINQVPTEVIWVDERDGSKQ